MDDAGGGRRGRRPALTARLLEIVESEYGLKVASARDLGGSANLNVLVGGDAGPVVVRAYRSHVVTERIVALQAARIRLAQHGIPTAQLVPTRSGDPFLESGSNIVEVERFVRSNEKMDSVDRVQAALPTLALVHEAFFVLDLGDAARHVQFLNYVSPIDLIDKTRMGTDRIRSWDPTREEAELADSADRLAVAATAAQEPILLPGPQLVHGDYWDNNVLFNRGAIVLVADLDFMNERLRIDDLALTLHFTSYQLEDVSGPAAANTLARLVDAYDAGASTSLSAMERAALPIALARQPLWSLAVWAALLDDERAARHHVEGHLAAVQRALDILNRLAVWQRAFA
ncbi:MAG: phosphotransferase enzyme family protein [Acidimicrobiia bacterium]